MAFELDLIWSNLSTQKILRFLNSVLSKTPILHLNKFSNLDWFLDHTFL